MVHHGGGIDADRRDHDADRRDGDGTAGGGRWAWAEIDLDAIGDNVRLFREMVAPAAVWAVVKADAYGHGSVPVARATIAAGAAGLCVALVQEGVEFRDAGITDPILVLSQQPEAQFGQLIDHDLTPTLYTASGIAAFADVVRRRARGPYGVQLKVDTGMNRVGVAPAEAVSMVEAIRSSDVLRLDGVFTHLAVADEPAHPANAAQLSVFAEVISGCGLHDDEVQLHALNSAGAIAFPAARYSLVRVGVALYGISPGPGLHAAHGEFLARLRPAMALKARVSHVKQIQPGDGVAYGHRFVAEVPMWLATVPIGYADGVPRALAFHGAEVLIGGVRRPMLGVVTMDQIIVAADEAVQVGDEVVLLGRQGTQEIRAEEWADRGGTIGYEITCGISRRIARHHRGDGRRH